MTEDEKEQSLETGKTWYEWILIFIGGWQLGTWIALLKTFFYNHLNCN